MTRRSLAQCSSLHVDRAELAEMLVCLLEMPADGLVVLARDARATLDPVGQTRVQLGTRAFQHAPVGGVTDQQMVKAQRGLSEVPARVRLDELAPPQRLDPRSRDRSRSPSGGGARPRCARSAVR